MSPTSPAAPPRSVFPHLLVYAPLLVVVLASAMTMCGPASSDGDPASSDAGRPAGALQAAGEFGAEGAGYGSPGYPHQIASIDSVMMLPIRDGRIAGASVGVVHAGHDVAFRAYGWADLELGAPTPVDAVYEVGSIAKQFTAAALLQMQEEELVDLDAEMSRWLPDFPTQGNRITVRRLLNHTSGIRGYTEMPAAIPYFVRRVPRDSLLALVAAHPFDFATGDHLIYNNSAYYLAGMILEEASGVSYEEYLEERLLGELEMERSRYCSETEIQEGKVEGYDAGEDGLRHKGFIVHNVPYAAGSLCSTARDLTRWIAALHGGRVLSEESYRQITEPATLNDGTRTRYALGLMVSDILGHQAIHHGGGIFGFLAESLYLPEDDLIVVVLTNTAGPPGPSELARAIVKIMVGEVVREPETFEGDLAWYEGTFDGPARGGRAAVRIAADGDMLTATLVETAGEAVPEARQETDTLIYRSGTTFANGDALLTFEADADPAGGDPDAPTPDAATTLRWDMVAGYTVMRRR